MKVMVLVSVFVFTVSAGQQVSAMSCEQAVKKTALASQATTSRQKLFVWLREVLSSVIQPGNTSTSQPSARSRKDEPVITPFNGTKELPAGEFSQSGYLGGYSLWLNGNSSSYKVSLQGRFEKDADGVFIIHATPIEAGKVSRPAAEAVMMEYILATEPQIQAIRLQIRPKSREDIHTNWDFQNKEALDFATALNREVAEKGIEALEGNSAFQNLRKLGFEPVIEKSGLEKRQNDDHGHYFVWMAKVHE